MRSNVAPLALDSVSVPVDSLLLPETAAKQVAYYPGHDPPFNFLFMDGGIPIDARQPFAKFSK